jgi:hypothetical protein
VNVVVKKQDYSEVDPVIGVILECHISVSSFDAVALGMSLLRRCLPIFDYSTTFGSGEFET